MTKEDWDKHNEERKPKTKYDKYGNNTNGIFEELKVLAKKGEKIMKKQAH